MNNQKEIYEALLAGETLIEDNGDKAVLLNGNLYDPSHNMFISRSFMAFRSWQIYKEPVWYENIPEGGVLCWIGDYGKIIKDLPVTITKHSCSGFTSVIGTNWVKAQPLTKQEIKVFMDNAPEDV